MAPILFQTKLFKTILIAITSLLMLSQIGHSFKTITPYLLEDQYFDRIFKVEDNKKNKDFYLHVYCKQKNMLSISISQQLQFQEHPRFPIHPTWKQTPKMQRKLYTFFQSCHIDLDINQNQLTSEENFVLNVRRKDTGVSIFTIKDFDFKASDQIIIDIDDYSTKWGLGQRFQNKFHVSDGIWTIWNRDRPWEIDQGTQRKSGQTYGHQPVYLAKENSQNGKFHLAYLKNTHGLTFESTQQSKQIRYTITGAPIHFIIIYGDHPETVIQQYHHYIGNAHVPPFWSMGYHQSRWGYRSIQQVSSVIQQFDSLGIPIDTIWSDLDYMDKKAIFTIDKTNYPPQKVNKLLDEKQLHYIPLIDVGVSIADFLAMDKGKQMKVFLKNFNLNNHRKSTGYNYQAKVWPGTVHFVDYLHPNASTFWENQLDRLYSQIKFSGIWLDMNQPSNFAGNQYVEQSYRIQHSQSINMMTIDVNLNHYCTGSSQKNLKHKEVHAYYGHLSTLPTHSFLKKHGRPFIISRSNSVGSGAYAGHWTGDNVATWDFLRLSISGNFLFQIFGIQTVGADICGFRGNTNQQLCSRWMQVGSMYPFARNHNENQSISQQPYRFGKILIQTTKLSFLQRYSLLKQMYSTLVNLNGTGSFYRPIIFEFPQDIQAYNSNFVQTQFMIGDYLLGAPIVEQYKQKRQVYFPGNSQQIWYHLEFDKSKLFKTENIQYNFGGNVATIQNPLPSPPPLFLRGGRLILVNQPTTRTSKLSSNFTIYAGLNKKQQCIGQFLLINDFDDEYLIQQCVNRGCNISLNLLPIKSQSGQIQKFNLQWKSNKNSRIQDHQQRTILIEKVIIFDHNIVYQSIPGSIPINRLDGRTQFKIKSYEII